MTDAGQGTHAERDTSLSGRLAFFAERKGDRYWWHRIARDAFVPDVYALLQDDEWGLLADWFDETDRLGMHGECAVPLAGWLTSFVNSNAVSRVVQLGTYAGYSTLLLGWALRRMKKERALVAVDIDPKTQAFASSWALRAGLASQVEFVCGDSASREVVDRTLAYLGAPPQIVFIDSSHAYAHTLRELELWYGVIAPGSLIVLHDTSAYSAAFDSTGQGGVLRAFSEWRSSRAGVESLSLANPMPRPPGFREVYLDSGTGLGVVVKPAIADKPAPKPPGEIR